MIGLMVSLALMQSVSPCVANDKLCIEWPPKSVVSNPLISVSCAGNPQFCAEFYANQGAKTIKRAKSTVYYTFDTDSGCGTTYFSDGTDEKFCLPANVGVVGELKDSGTLLSCADNSLLCGTAQIVGSKQAVAPPAPPAPPALIPGDVVKVWGIGSARSECWVVATIREKVKFVKFDCKEMNDVE